MKFDIFSRLVEPSNDPVVDRLASPTTTITHQHFGDICKAFSAIPAANRAALLFVLSAVFVKYSSQAFFGTENDSPVALRFYASALLNKLKTLDQSLFDRINGQTLQDNLFKDSCTDILSSNMAIGVVAHHFKRDYKRAHSMIAVPNLRLVAEIKR